MSSAKSAIIKVICLQVLWYLFVSYGAILGFYSSVLALVIYFINLKIFKDDFSLSHKILVLTFFIIYGIAETSLLNKLSFLFFDEFPHWIISLYIIFLCYYGDTFEYLAGKKWYLLSLLGAIGGVFAFYAGVNISKMQVTNPSYLIAIGASWAIFFPVSIKMFYSKDLKDKILDFSIFYSFDKSGFLRHQKSFQKPLSIKSDANVLITGGTSGIGLAVAQTVVKNKANAFVVGRDDVKGQNVASQSERIIFIKHDMIDWDALDSLVENLPRLDYVVLNAGGMPSTFIKNKYGIEAQMASQLFGHYYLIKKLYIANKIKKNAVIVWVSSGGMYLKKLTLANIKRNLNYDKVATYAIVKRAQVELLSTLKGEFKDMQIVGMHPGWVDTPGIQSAISGFAKKMSNRLRNADQGADTICWLISQEAKPISGEFYFDRSVVRKNAFWFTKTDPQIVSRLYKILNEFYEKISIK